MGLVLDYLLEVEDGEGTIKGEWASAHRFNKTVVTSCIGSMAVGTFCRSLY